MARDVTGVSTTAVNKTTGRWKAVPVPAFPASRLGSLERGNTDAVPRTLGIAPVRHLTTLALTCF